jgi:hypothetical protein
MILSQTFKSLFTTRAQARPLAVAMPMPRTSADTPALAAFASNLRTLANRRVDQMPGAYALLVGLPHDRQ